MVTICSREEVTRFLFRFKMTLNDYLSNINTDALIIRMDRRENRTFSDSKGMGPTHIIKELLNLETIDYSNGPEDNSSKDGPKKGNIWIFGEDVDGTEVYIKIHDLCDHRLTKYNVISFHPSNYTISYPFKKGR